MIDILIPVYRAKMTLDRCIASIVMQTERHNIRVSLLNDHPQEEDYSVFIERYSPILDIHELQMAESRGLGSVRQFGIDSTDGEFFAFVDADDTLSDSRAIETMLRAMDEDVAVCSGAFQELLADGSIIQHVDDMIWVFAKLYRRSFWERYDISFMQSSSANEDTGVNAIVALLSSDTDRIVFIPDVVYQWHFNYSSITRQDDHRYTYDQNITGYADNMIRAINHVRTVMPSNQKINRRVVYDICNLYKMHLDTFSHAPQYLQNSWRAAKKYYDSCFPTAGVSNQLIAEEYDHVMYGNEFPLRGVVPYITLTEFIRTIAEDEGNIRNVSMYNT